VHCFIAGSIKEHESVCDYAIIQCPNGDPQTCGLHRRRSIQKHLVVCQYVPCPHQNKGRNTCREVVRFHVLIKIKVGTRAVKLLGSMSSSK